MPCDRLTRRALVVLIAIVIQSTSTGCLCPSNIRPATPPAAITAPSAQPVPGVGATPAAAPISAAPTPPPTISVPPNPPPPITNQSQSAVANDSVASTSVLESITPDTASPQSSAQMTAAPVATPLLDAAIERVEAVTRLELESVVPTPSPAPAPAAPLAAAVLVPTPALPAATPTPGSETPLADPQNIDPTKITTGLFVNSSSESASDPVAVPVVVSVASPEPVGALDPPIPPDLSATRSENANPPHDDNRRAESHDAQPAADVPIPVSPRENRGEFGLSELHVCAKVHGFGSIEPLDQTKLKSGQRLLLYCEVTGMEYEPKDESFRSRLSSRIEIKAADNGLVLWDYELGSAEDVCRHRRRDYFVNYLLELPRNLIPGNYQMRLTQTDLVANRSTSAGIPIQIVP